MNNVKIVVKSDLQKLEQLWRDIEREEHPGDGEAQERAVREARLSLSVFDYLDSDSFWIFAAEADHRYVGYAAAARIPKADARVGFLYIDELYVLADYRNRGHATRIMEPAMSQAMSLRLGGILLCWSIMQTRRPAVSMSGSGWRSETKSSANDTVVSHELVRSSGFLPFRVGFNETCGFDVIEHIRAAGRLELEGAWPRF